MRGIVRNRVAISLIVILAAAGMPTRVLGQTRWLVLGAGVENEAASLQRWTGRVVEELQDAGEAVVLLTGDVEQHLREELSFPFEPAPSDLERDLGGALEPAVFAAAEGNATGVRERVEPLLSRAELQLSALNRAPTVFNDLGNLCYLVVRSHLYERHAELAREATLRCLRIAPEFDPGSDLHPPDVRRMHDDVAQRIAEGDSASLSIELPSSAVTRTCRIEVNGREVGQAPAIRRFVPAGMHFVGVVCNDDASPRRVHRLSVTRDTPVRVVIDPVFDRALGQQRNLLLYGRHDGLPSIDTLHSHARSIGDAVQANGILLVTAARGTVEIQRIPTSARARITESDANDLLDDAVAAVVAGRSFERGARTEDATTTDRARRRPILGPVLLGVAGLGSIGVIVGGAIASGCTDRAADGFCEREGSINPGAAALYGGLGAAAIAGAIIWFILGGQNPTHEPATARLGFGSNGVSLEATF